jgi:anaerobic ribonucleoside-triphosphate reductase activating protein
MPVAAVAEEVLPGLAGADGLTLSGGEPFDQPQALARLIALLRERYVELEVLAYSGYLLEELQQAGSAVAELLRAIDMLIDGAYREEMPCTLIWRGSDNQRLHLLSPRAQRHAWAVAAPWPEPRPLQVRALGGTRWLIAGIPHRGGLEIMRAGLRARGFGVIPKAAEPGG